ncbi:hypothetical protein RYX36_026915 [Vicia faba]
MGSSSSKGASSCSSSSSCSLRKNRSKRHRGFPSYCLRTTSGSRDSDNDERVCDHNKVNGSDVTYTSSNEIDSDEAKSESFKINNLSSSPTLSPLEDTVRDEYDAREMLGMNVFPPRVNTEAANVMDRRNGARDPVDRNVRFSRTLRRDASEDSVRQVGERGTGVSPSDRNNLNSHTTSGYPLPNRYNSPFRTQDHEVEASRSRETRYQDLLEHRSNFLERRRRIQSQVRALQRLGSRFENLSGNDRSCILSGQYRNGRCTCRISSRKNNSNSNDDTNSRASISRIVMLAEALFEVLDEIHQQSVVLSSRPSVSSIGSIFAPAEVVESLPVKIYTKSHKHQEEPIQCYICLVEYEDGDNMRVLPCHHEFHTTCIDKWLKEIHRICPLCRGDICI